MTCQSSNPQASDLMSRVLALNCPRKSTAKIVQRLDASILPADVLVLESLDVGLLGENCLHQLAEAHQDGLISDKTEIIPSKAVVWSVLASVTIQDCKLRGGETIDLSPLDIFDRCLTDEGYSSINLSSDPRKITFLSEPVVAMNIDFTSDMNGLLMSREQSVVFNCTEGGRANAIISWFSSFADKDHLFTTGPGQAMDAALYWLPFESVKANDQVGVKITQVPNGIAFKFDGTAVSHRSHSVLLKKMKLAHRSLTASLSGSHMALMDPAESRQIALLALNLSSHSPTAATFHQRIISTL